MDSSIDTINMNNCNVRLSSVSIEIWLYQPEAYVLMTFQAHKIKPLHKSTRVLFVLMPKGEEKKNTSYFNPCGLSIPGLALTRTQSYHAGPFLHEEVDQMCSQRMPVIPLISLGA